jgi:hypothetical protein
MGDNTSRFWRICNNMHGKYGIFPSHWRSNIGPSFPKPVYTPSRLSQLIYGNTYTPLCTEGVQDSQYQNLVCVCGGGIAFNNNLKPTSAEKFLVYQIE